ncbi:MAG: NUDIX domain-containing protein [Candidatus Micrarchaeota archaeon]|nr:NUDIX domain-containing protein [Candidatus Micrarchaeota archaeon]MDE1847731.1 NUDIX domain-containing protein [Candidatus Micrarchaeota archaeon]MDE1864160.1 NUDIX domain-containing protein [Candidatus Micrarchaeota archaeon]
MKSRIPAAPYRRIQRSMPILCVDVIIKTDDGLLFGVRKNEPAKGKVWYIGGRVLKGELLESAVKRKVKEETGLKVRISRMVGVYETFFFSGENRHTVAVLYLVEKIGGLLNLKNSDLSELVYLKKSVKGMDKYVKQGIIDSGALSAKKHNAFQHRAYFYR